MWTQVPFPLAQVTPLGSSEQGPVNNHVQELLLPGKVKNQTGKGLLPWRHMDRAGSKNQLSHLRRFSQVFETITAVY